MKHVETIADLPPDLTGRGQALRLRDSLKQHFPEAQDGSIDERKISRKTWENPLTLLQVLRVSPGVPADFPNQSSDNETEMCRDQVSVSISDPNVP